VQETFGFAAAQQGVGVDVALFGNGHVQMTGHASVEAGGLLKAGHATQRRCSADK
jgi:hypothetical protein